MAWYCGWLHVSNLTMTFVQKAENVALVLSSQSAIKKISRWTQWITKTRTAPLITSKYNEADCVTLSAPLCSDLCECWPFYFLLIFYCLR